MGHHKGEEHNGHRHNSDDGSDDDGRSVRKFMKKKESRKRNESHVESSSSSSGSSSSRTSSSKSASHHHHQHSHHRHHHGDDNGTQVLGEEEEVESPGMDGSEDSAPEESLEEIDHGQVEVSEAAGEDMPEERGLSDRVVVEREEGIREESDNDESEVSDAPVYGRFLVESCLKEDHKMEAEDDMRSAGVDEATLDKQGSEKKKKYDVVLSENMEGVHDAGNCESAEKIVDPESVKEIAIVEGSEEPFVVAEPEEENTAKEVTGENTVFITEDGTPVDEKREISDGHEVEGEGEGNLDFSSTGNRTSEKTLEESAVSKFEGNGNAYAESVVSGIVKSESTEETVVAAEDEEESVKDVIEESNIGKLSASKEQAGTVDYMIDSEQKEISAAVEEYENSNELEAKGGHDELLEGRDGSSKDSQPVRGQLDPSVELGSPLEHQRRFMRQFMTPSPPKRENSVYKIVMALEGLQVGEKCIHGEIDHGICHQRYGDRRMTPSPSFSSSARYNRETSTSPKDGDEGADDDGRSAEVTVSEGEKREVDSAWSFVQYDSQSGQTTQQTSAIKTETYTDTVVFRRDDGFLPRTPGRSPLSGSQSMRAVFTQADASAPTTPRLKIVHEFPAEKNSESHDSGSTSTLASLSVEGESEVERILRLQETHDLVCPVCRSCITKRVILRKRKRTTVISTDKWETEVHDEEEENPQSQAHDNVGDGDTVVEQYEDYGCLACFTFLFRRERGVQRTQVAEVSGAAEAAASVSVASTSQTTDQNAVRLPEPIAAPPPALTDADYDNHCLPIFFTWRRKTTSPAEAEVVAPLLSKEDKTLSEESPVEFLETQSRDVPAEDLPSEVQKPASSEIHQNTTSEIQLPPASEILELPTTPGAVEGIQLPVVVVESREDRLCFPFLWRRASKTTQVQSEYQPLLAKEDTKHQSDEFKQQSEDVEKQSEAFTHIEDDLWMGREVLLEVPVSVPPQEKLITPPSRSPDSSETAAESDTIFKPIRVTEAERRVDCLCFPSWRSTETTSEETEALLPSVISGTEHAEIVSPMASSTEDRGSQRASLNCMDCMDILIPPYPWGPPGTGSRTEVLRRAEEHSGSATSTQFEFDSVGQVISVKESDSQSQEAQRVIVMAQVPEGSGISENKLSTMRTEDSRCLPLLLPTISWRRQELRTEEILDQPRKTKTAEFESSVTSEYVSGAAETKLSQEKEVGKEIEFGDIEASRNQNQKIEEIHNDIAAEVVDEEEVPLVRKPLKSKSPMPSKVEPLPEVLQTEITFTQDLTRAPSLPTELPVDGRYEEEIRDKGNWNCCLPSHSQLTSQSSVFQDVMETPSSPAVLHVDETPAEERERGSWNCCLPSYTQLAYHSLEDRVTGEQAAPGSSGVEASGSHVSDKSESIFHEEITRETTIDALVTTQTKTTKSHTDATDGEIIDAVRIDTSLSHVHASVQHDEGAVEATLHLDDHPTFSFQPADKLSASPILEEDHKPVTQPPLEPTYSTGYAALARSLEDEEEEADEDAVVNERLADSSRQGVTSEKVEPLKVVTVAEEDSGEDLSIMSDSFEEDAGEKIVPSEVVTEATVPPMLSDSLQEDDRCSCLPKSRWLWGRPKLTSEEAQLREPLLGIDTQTQLQQAGLLQRDSEVDSKIDSSVHVTLQQTHEVTHTTMGSIAGRTSDEEDCNCFPWGGRYTRDSTETDTTVTVAVDDTVIEVEGTDVTSTLAAARDAAENAGMLDERLIQEPEYLKSIVYGGLDISLTSLGVVASAAGGDVKTRNVLALGLANLIFGFIAFFSKIQDLHKESPARFQESVGPRIWINGPLAMISFLFFGALPVLTFGFSFRQLNDHDYKMAATILVSLVAIVFLGCGKVAAKMTELSYWRTISTLIGTGIVAAVAGFYTGDYISKLLEKYGILDQ